MWIYTDTGLLSVVADRDTKEFLWIRSRNRKAIESFTEIQPTHTPHADYHWRVRMGREEFSTEFAAYVSSMTYGNFKNHVQRVSPELMPVYYQVYNWSLDLDDLDERNRSVETH